MNLIAWIFLIEGVAIVTVNMVAIVIFTRTPRLRCRKYSLIVNLAVADLFVGLVSVPMYTADNSIDIDMDRRTFLYIYTAQDPFFGLASLFGLAAIAIERVFATYYPFRHRALCRLKYKIGIAMVWTCAFLPTITYVVERHVINFLDMLGHAVITIVVITLPIAIVIVSYFLIWVRVSFKGNIPHNAIHHSNVKLAVTLSIVTLVSIFAWIPFMIFSIFHYSCYFSSKCVSFFQLKQVFQVVKAFQYGNSFVNFVIYFVRMRDFRAEILRRMRCVIC